MPNRALLATGGELGSFAAGAIEGRGMQTAGGIIGLIAGVFGVFAALLTLMFGGRGSAFNENAGSLVAGLGWGGILFSFLCIIFAAVAMNARSKTAGVLLALCEVAGAILGGTLVATFMVLALVGGILAIVGARPRRPRPH